jgi:hypothetical protein
MFGGKNNSRATVIGHPKYIPHSCWHFSFFFSSFSCIIFLLESLVGTVEVFDSGSGFKKGTWQRTFFLLDPGAMHDIIVDESLLQDTVQSINVSSSLILADGMCIVVDKRGKLYMSFCYGCHAMVLSDVLFSPKGSLNLLSIGRVPHLDCGMIL